MSNDKTAEEIERERIIKDAEDFAFQVPYNGTKDFYDMKKYEGYIAGATHELNRSAQQLKGIQRRYSGAIDNNGCYERFM